MKPSFSKSWHVRVHFLSLNSFIYRAFPLIMRWHLSWLNCCSYACISCVIYYIWIMDDGGVLNRTVRTLGIVETINTVSTWICKMANPLRCKLFPWVLQRVYYYLLQFIASCWSAVFFISIKFLFKHNTCHVFAFIIHYVIYFNWL